MSVLITGAAGFVGLSVAEAVLADGREAVLFDTQPLPESARMAFARLPGAYHEIVGDTRDAAALDAAFEAHGVARVVHGAAVTGAYERERSDAATILAVNVMGTLAVLEAARRHGVQRFLYPGSVTVYGESLYMYDAMDEGTTPPVPVGTYGITKYAAERLSLRYRDLWGMDVVAARIGVVFGPWERDTSYRDTLSLYSQTARLAVRGEEAVLPAERFRRDWVYSRDLAAALVALLDAEALRYTVYNIASGTVSDDAPAWCTRLQARFPRFSWRVAGKADEANILNHEDRHRRPQSVARLHDGLGFRPAFDFDAACDDFLAWIAATPGYWTE
jgi:UDP-glucose 4-epimerase